MMTNQTNIIKKEELFKAAYFEHYDKIKFFAVSYLHDFDEAENVAQDVYMSLWEKMEDLGVDSDPLYLLYTIARWKCLNILRRDKRDSLYKDGVIRHDKDSISAMALNDTTCLSLHWKEVNRLCELAIEEMSDKVREAFLLSRGADMTYKEIANKLDISQKTVEYRIGVSFRILRKYLNDYIKFIIFWI